MRSGSSFYYAKQNSKMISVSLYNLPVSVFSAAGNTGKGWKTEMRPSDFPIVKIIRL